MVPSKKLVVTTLVTWIFFSLEAFIHFSLGKDKIEAPTVGEIFKIFGVVLVFSLLSSFFSHLAVKACCEKNGNKNNSKTEAVRVIYLDESSSDED